MLTYETAEGIDKTTYCRFQVKDDVGNVLGMCGVPSTHVLYFEKIPEREPQGACLTHGLKVVSWWHGLSMMPINVWVREKKDADDKSQNACDDAR